MRNMLIFEAVKEAIKTDGVIVRKAYYGNEIKPTNTPDGLMIFSKTEGKPPAKWWQPCADDLMAEDWEVVNL